jgi:two-component sensor histidine kinase/PAS domain-containing protein
MSQILDYLFGAAGFVPQGACLLWRPDLLALHAVSDGLIALSYLVIPAAILVFMRRRTDLPDGARWVGLLFMAFIVAGAATHLAALATLWVPAYGAEGLVKAGAAGISLATAIAVWPQLPKLLVLPSPVTLERANAALAEANARLEAKVAERTHELQMIRQRFEQALSRSNITVSIQDRDLKYTWVHNPRPWTAGQMLGHTDHDLLPGDLAEQTETLKRRAVRTGEAGTMALSLPVGDEGSLYLDLTVSPTRDTLGRIDGVLCTTLDFTEQRLYDIRLTAMAARLADAHRRFELALEGSSITVFEQDRDLRYSYMYNPPPGTTAEDFLGLTDAEIFPEDDLDKLVPPKRRVLAEGGHGNVELEVTIAGRPRFYDLRLEAKTGSAGVVQGVVGTAVDLTERRESERQLRLIMRELTHRSKNLLAVIQAMARQTAARSETMEAFVGSFSARLQAMAASHDLLVSRSWAGVELDVLLRAQLAQSLDPDTPQIRIEGPRLTLSADTAQNLGLAFHELTTNAAKYGALYADDGRLTVTWERAGGKVRIRWEEWGGPPVEKPQRTGFGRMLLERLVGASLNGTVDLDFRADGLVCTLTFPDNRILMD